MIVAKSPGMDRVLVEDPDGLTGEGKLRLLYRWGTRRTDVKSCHKKKQKDDSSWAVVQLTSFFSWISHSSTSSR